MGADDVRRLKQLEKENSRFNEIVVERDLEIEVMNEIAAKIYGSPRFCKLHNV
jgi:putative transposase